ncbi:MAG: energy transducer TonB [Gammaproteobacteria bacterium HGW-Gammaproteobacteria-3]|nr:MAG: energy transducer TonB [Gammaproteobacteria bacterium HGW-Gammaproteobacteria-3]
MANKTSFGEVQGISVGDKLLIALFIAVIVHAAIILGVNFTDNKLDEVSRAIEITLANTPAKKAPKQASFLAQENQIGAGAKKSKPEPPRQKLPSDGQNQKKLPQKKPAAEAKAAPKKIISGIQPDETKTAQAETARQMKPTKAVAFTAEALQRQISQLGEQIREQHQSADLSKIKHVSAVSTHKYMASQYMRDWEKKVEEVGNLNYPEVARKKNFYGTLILEVGINADGGIYSIRVKQSSGNASLDEAAKRIVQISAPFAPLPTELLKELEVLVITRVWKFSDESGMTTR